MKIRNVLSQQDAEKRVHAFGPSGLDHCGSLLSGRPSKSVKSLQLVQDAAARVLTGTRRHHITALSFSAFAPCKTQNIKILLLTYKALNYYDLDLLCEKP